MEADQSEDHEPEDHDESSRSELIDELLRQHRPDRYDSTDRMWREPVYDRIVPLVEAGEARRVAAKQLVDVREARATRTTNKVLRQIQLTHQFPLGNLDLERTPLSVGKERVLLGVATPRDFRVWATDERRDTATESTARFQACDGAEWVAKQLEAGGWATYSEAVAALTPEEAGEEDGGDS
jgi:hypothetical protein